MIERTHLANLTARLRYQRNQRRTGTISEVLRGLSEETIVWLFDNVPEGGTVADVIRSIIVDAHDEEST